MSYTQKVEAFADRGGDVANRMIEVHNTYMRSPGGAAAMFATLPMFALIAISTVAVVAIAWPIAWVIDALRGKR